MQFELALGAGSVGIKPGREDRAAVGAAAACYRAHHAGRSRAELIGPARTAGRRFAVVMNFFFFIFFRVAITAVAVLAIHKRLRPPICTDYCLRKPAAGRLLAHHNLAEIHSDCYTRPACAIA